MATRERQEMIQRAHVPLNLLWYSQTRTPPRSLQITFVNATTRSSVLRVSTLLVH